MIAASILAVVTIGMFVAVFMMASGHSRNAAAGPAPENDGDGDGDGDGADIIDLSAYEPRTLEPAGSELHTIDLRHAQTWHIGGSHPSLGLPGDRGTAHNGLAVAPQPDLTLIDGGGESPDTVPADRVSRVLRVVDHEPHAYFELINLMDWAENRDRSPT